MPEFANPFVNIVPRKMSRAELVQALRIDMGAEIEAINIYEAHFAATEDENARRVLAHVIVGARVPVLISSRTDKSEARILSMAMGVLMSRKK